ncbi:hypothetical protein QF002_001271 [Paraburkholderia youngii]
MAPTIRFAQVASRTAAIQKYPFVLARSRTSEYSIIRPDARVLRFQRYRPLSARKGQRG